MIKGEVPSSTRKAYTKKKPTNQKRKLGAVLLGQVTRALRTLRDLKGDVYIVGGVVTEGASLRDIDIIVSDKKDIPKIKKALGKYKKWAHFNIQKEEPQAPEFVKVTGERPKSPDLKKGKPKNKYEYAGPE